MRFNIEKSLMVVLQVEAIIKPCLGEDLGEDEANIIFFRG